MRLHSLTLSAIGPFPGSHTIDFATLSAGGLFLLEGPTGAGKSTIIDAVVFALYGEPASTGASRDRLTSRHAPPGTAPVVDLIFETTAGVHRVRRSPEHQRPKQRGTGLTKEQAQVRLWRLVDPDDEVGQPLSTRVGEADAEILRIVGLSREQFVQTVVLPQGEFATFLEATPEARRAVLQRLFGTEIYQRMQDQLADAARVAKRRAEDARTQAGQSIQGFVRVATAPGTAANQGTLAPIAEPDLAADLLAGRLAQMTALADTPEEATLNALAADVAASFHEAADGLRQAEAAARDEELRARSAFDEARRLAEHLSTRQRFLAEWAELSSRDKEMSTVEASLGAARRAGRVVPTILAAAQAEAVAHGAGANLAELRAAIGASADRDLAEPDADLPALVAQAQHDRGALDPALILERALPRRRVVGDTARAALAEQVAEQDAAVRRLEARPGRRCELEEGLVSLRERAGRAATTEVRLARARQILAAAENASVLAASDERARRVRAERRQAAQEAVAQVSALRLRRIEDISGELAESLRPEEPCPVCGGLEHPAPATRSEAAVTESDLIAAEDACAEAERLLGEATDLAAEVSSQHRAAQASSEGRDVPAATEDVRRHTGDLERERAAGLELAAQEGALAGFDAETDDLRGAAARLATEVATSRERLSALEHELARDGRTVDEARGSWPSVADRVTALATRAASAERLQAAAEARVAADARQCEQAAALARVLDSEGFAGADEARAAALDDAAYRRLEALVQQHAGEKARVSGGLAAPEIAALIGTEVADVEGTGAALGRATATHLETARAAERALAVLSAVEQEAEALSRSLAADTAAQAAAAPVRRMAELATAGEANDRHHTLATFVLLRRFEEVIDAANLRLAAMSDDRYALARTDGREGGVAARKAGLGLVVEDHLVGDQRAPRTLSGGETFYVSLCLALGLADVVRAEAGGVDLGTLFIDEGFGSLDPETLDTVLRELGQLRSGGRVVGIVSHVAELKRRVAERVEVRRRPDGSSTLSVVA